MAARLSRSHSETVRQKIQASVLIDRLHKHVMGKLDMDKSQVTAALGLLDRSVPKLATIQHVGDPENPVETRVKVEFVSPRT